MAAKAAPVMLEWAADSATLISLEVVFLRGWFRVQTADGQVLQENELPSAGAYHEIVSAHEVIMPGDMRIGIALEVADVSTGKIVFQQADPAPDAPGTASGAIRFALPPDKSIVVVGYGFPRSDQPITLLDTKSWRTLKTVSVPADGPTGVGLMRLSHDGKRLAYLGSHGLVIVDVESGEVVSRFSVGESSDFVFSPDGELLAISGQLQSNRTIPSSNLYIIKVSNGAVVTSLQSNASASVGHIRWDSQDRFLAFIVDGNAVHFWNYHETSSRVTVVHLKSISRDLALSPDGKKMAVGDGSSIDILEIGR